MATLFNDDVECCEFGRWKRVIAVLIWSLLSIGAVGVLVARVDGQPGDGGDEGRSAAVYVLCSSAALLQLGAGVVVAAIRGGWPTQQGYANLRGGQLRRPF